MHTATPQEVRLSNTEVLSYLPSYLSHLPVDQSADVMTLICKFPCLFNNIIFQTSVH